jgi:hypothetical protein
VSLGHASPATTIAYEDLQGYAEVISLVRDGVAQREAAGPSYDLQAQH